MAIEEKARIDRASLVEISIPFVEPFQISGGVSHSRKSIIVELESDGVTGYGESPPFEAPFYSSETTSSAKALLTEWLLPRVVDREVQSIASLNELIGRGIKGNNFARSGLETAYWDLVAKKNGIHLRDLILHKLRELGTPEESLANEDYITSGVSIGIPVDEDEAVFTRWVERSLEEGYRRVKIKIRPGWDLLPSRLARDIIGYDFPFWVDANASYDLEQHVSTLKELHGFRCLFLEQPLGHDDLLDHSKLSHLVDTPLCVDESLKSIRAARHITELGFSTIWNLKVHRVGGLWEAVNIYRFATAHGVALWGGTMPESGIGSMCILSLATLCGFKFAADIEPSQRWYEAGTDLKELEMDSYGRIYVPQGAGIGEINMDNYRRFGRLVWRSW
jgi:O-succinylbenzoate synthase